MPVVCSTVVLTLSSQNLDLLRSCEFIHTKHRKDRRLRQDKAFKRVTLKKPHSKIVYLLYANGKCVILGACTPYEVIRSTRWICRTLKATLLSLPLVRNVVYVGKYSQQSNGSLQDMYSRLSVTHRVSLEPELSPALIVESQTNPLAKIMIFRTGKVNITGVKNFESLEPVLLEVDALLNTNINHYP